MEAQLGGVLVMLGASTNPTAASLPEVGILGLRWTAQYAV